MKYQASFLMKWIQVLVESPPQMADKLLMLSKNRQVICISHLAQIADLSDQLIVIDKTHQNQQTQVFAKQVINEEKECQINTMRGLIKQ